MAYEIGDIARLTANFTSENTHGSIEANTSSLAVDAADNYDPGDAVLVVGAGPGGSDLATTITGVTGNNLGLDDLASVTVVDTDVGLLTDPGSVSITVTEPNGDAVNVSPDRVSEGRYRADFPISQDGVHFYRWESVGAATGALEGTFVVEQSPFAHLSARALFALDELKQFLGSVARKDDDATLVRVANDASATIHREARREFVARNAVRDPGTGIVTVAPETRRFGIVTTTGLVNIGDLAGATWPGDGVVTVGVAASDTTALSAVDDSLIVYEPRVRDPWEPIRTINMGAARPLVGQIIEVNGIWGFPQIPDDIRMAAMKLAAGSYYRDVRRWGEELQDTTIVDLPRTLIGSALKTARDYRHTPPIVTLAVT
jgi:hypothetical protein